MKSLNIRKKLVTLAVASVVSGGAMMAMTAPAHAMNVSQNNVGEVLLFPYYTVKNGYDTVFTVTNTSDKTAVFKVRFREALNSREVRDFNVILSPHDHWAGAVTRDGADGALFRTYDKTCTSPRLPGMVSNDDRAAAGSKGEIFFTNSLLTDGAGSDMTRVQEGYFEVILMGVSDAATNVALNTLEYNAKHVDGVPRDCAVVDNLFLDVGANLSYMAAPENILKGHVTYINVVNGQAIDAEPTAIENFTDTNIVYAPGDALPDLGSAEDDQVVYFLNNGAPEGGPVAGSSENAVSVLLSANSVINEFATGAGASTSWVLTFPTKHHYTDGTLRAPFSSTFTNKSCDPFEMDMFNREEATAVNVDNTNFSPAPPEGGPNTICYEANVLNFNGTSVFGIVGANHKGVSTADVGTAGWARIRFSGFTVDGNPVEPTLEGVVGLPAIGFAAIMRDADSAIVNYGSSTEHTISRAMAVPQ